MTLSDRAAALAAMNHDALVLLALDWERELEELARLRVRMRGVIEAVGKPVSLMFTGDAVSVETQLVASDLGWRLPGRVCMKLCDRDAEILRKALAAYAKEPA